MNWMIVFDALTYTHTSELLLDSYILFTAVLKTEYKTVTQKLRRSVVIKYEPVL